ncbi:hypothetical protein BFP72_07455 [Reichenbachiella sp. 5M10]|nr:hypothetical protein BFP72_07455 [Reichenbachiella sp. 5M10]
MFSLVPLWLEGYMSHPALESAMVVISGLIASYATGTGYYRHRCVLPLVMLLIAFVLIATGSFSDEGHVEVWMTSSGALLLAAAHVVNWKMLHAWNRP